MWPLCICGGCILALSGLLVGIVIQNRRWHRLADNRLQLIRHLIDLSYSYKEQPLKFLHHFCDAIRVPALRNSHIVQISRHTSYTETEEDSRFLIQLLDAGFSRREVCAIFDLKNINCLYVKFNRAKKKLKSLWRYVSDKNYSPVFQELFLCALAANDAARAF